MSRTQDAMQHYFEELLQDEAGAPAPRTSETVTRPRAPEPTPQVQTAALRSANDIYKEQEDRRALESLQRQKLQALLDQQKQPTEQLIDVSTAVIEAEVPADPQVATEEIKVPELLRWHENGRPLWAQNEFDVLLFDVSGLTLAVPLIALGQIQQIDDKLTPIFGQSDWFMGLLRGPTGNIKTVNTALFVMPEKYSETFLETARLVISIDGLNWGLAVDSVNQPSRIHPDEVKWRTDRSKRPWLAGTVKSAMCALIDIPQMGKILQASEK